MDFSVQTGLTPLSNEVNNLQANGTGQGPTGATGPSNSSTGPTGPTGPGFYYVNPTGAVSGTGCIMKYGTQVIWTYTFVVPAGSGVPYVIADCPPEISPPVLPGYTPYFFMSSAAGTFAVNFIIGENTLSLSGIPPALSSSGTCFASFSYFL